MTEWRKSSRSNTSGGDCVEVASIAGNIGVRDSKTVGAGYLSLDPVDFARLVDRIKDSALDL